jgi:hypothetical protein
MKLKFLLPIILLLGCGPTVADNTGHPGNPWHSEQTYHVDVVVGKYTRWDCINKGGTWVVGDNENYENALVGCIEKGAPQ